MPIASGELNRGSETPLDRGPAKQSDLEAAARLDATQQQQDNQDQDNQSQTAAGIVAPGTAVRPSGQGPEGR
jgi:hypothetical protein